MKIRNILLRSAATLVAVTILSSCDNDPENSTNSTITEMDGARVSAFDVDASTWGVGGASGDFEMVLVPDGEDMPVSFPAKLSAEGGRVRCSFTITHPVTVDDGVYRLYLFSRDGSRAGRTLEVRMRAEKLAGILSVPVLYKPMSGTGSAEDPFIVSKQSDFMSLIVDLDNEKGVHGRGYHYRQTADLEVPPQSSMTAGRGYYSAPFAGHYDGDGHKLAGLSYTGAMDGDRDSDIGLFSELLSGARVENVTVEGLDISRAMMCGAIAGRSSGTVTLHNVTATGNISLAGDYVGGLVGYVTDTLIVTGYDMNMTLSGNDCVGGVAGKVNDGYLYVKGLSTAKHRFRMTAAGNCGGVAGSLVGETYLEDISVDHSVQSADQDVTIITATSGQCAGGLFGYLETGMASTLKDVEILAPVSAPQYSGGIAGRAVLGQPLTLDGCKVSTVISGVACTGGFFGECDNTRGRNLVFSGDASKLITDFNAGEINGKDYTGGLCGYFTGMAPYFRTTFTLAMNIKATGDATGGLFGHLRGSSSGEKYVLDTWKVDFASNTMKITSKGNYVGGVAGKAYDYVLRAPYQFSLHSGDAAVAMDVEGMKPDFRGSVDGADYVGGVVGRAEGCGVEGYLMAGSVSGADYVGGIAGELVMPAAPYTLSMCALFSSASVYATGDYVGGIAGSVIADGDLGTVGAFTDCINHAAVRGNDYTGGVVGKIRYDGELNPEWLVNTGAVKGTGSAGGVVGRADGGSHKLIVENCANYGTVTASTAGGDGAGGIIGCTHSQRINVIGCANHGLIDCSGTAAGIGGVAGALGRDPGGAAQGENLFMAYCMNSAEVRCSDKNTHVAGLLGFQEEGSSNKHDDYCVRDCYNDGRVSSDQNDDNGGLVGKVSHYSYILRCVNYGKVDHGNACIGTRQSSAIVYHDYLYYLDGTGKDWYSTGKIAESALADQSKYKTFDFNTVWHTDRGRAELRQCPWQYIRTFSR